nr:hypothetical protein [Tanacetum cinerariifolium]
MANQEQIPSQQEQPFVAAKQVGFNLENIILNTNNKVALLYHKHNNKDYFKCVSDFISKCYLREPFTKSPNMYKEYLAKFWYSPKALENTKVSFSIPTGGIYSEVGESIAISFFHRDGDGEVTLYPTQVFSVNNWALKPNQPKEPPFTYHMLPICSVDKAVVFKALKLSSNAERVSEGTKPRAQLGHKKHLTSSKQPFVSSKEATKASFIIHFESASGNDALSVSIAEADLGNSPPNQTKSVSEGLETIITQPITGKRASSIARQVEEEEASNTIKLEGLAKLVSNVQPSFKDLDSPGDDHVIVVNDSDDDEENEVHTTTNAKTEDTSVPKSSSPSLLPTKLNDLPSKFNKLTKEVKGLKKQVHELEIELLGDLKEIPTKLEDFTKTVTSLTSQAKMTLCLLRGRRIQIKQPSPSFFKEELKRILKKKTRKTNNQKQFPQSSQPLIKCNLLSNVYQKAPFNPRGGISRKTMAKRQCLQRRLRKKNTNNDSNDDETHVTGSMVEPSTIKKLKKFNFIIKDGRHIYLTENEINHQKKLENDAKVEAAKQEREYDRYYDKILNRRAESRITDCDVLTKKGPITLKVYRVDGTSEVIPNFKASNLHLGEWREVVKACPNRTGKGWKTIYGQIQTRMDHLHATEAELGINLDIPLSEQDPFDKLNDLANKKRKHVDDIHDYFKANKILKSSVQYEEHLPSTVLNEPVLGPGLDDHASRFSSLLLTEVDKRNLNPLKQTRTIEQLRQEIM